MKFKHKSVLLHETIDNLNPKDDGLYVDATFGGGGHARYLLSKLNRGTVIGFDQDEYAISMAKESFAEELKPGAEPKLILVHDNFCHLKENLVELGISDGIDGIYYDLGVSSPQFDQPERG
ncbi:MAG: 16S rRNA (cytosine(1402)-N(4))-methyltransferase, partial [Lactobacillus paragasseri]|nr:16S rRNA (cytosine(1402)-N(4))-methyltransferase [Lactobacillus paragasseri]